MSRNRKYDDKINKRLAFEGSMVICLGENTIKKYVNECVRKVGETVFDIMTNI